MNFGTIDTPAFLPAHKNLTKMVKKRGMKSELSKEDDALVLIDTKSTVARLKESEDSINFEEGGMDLVKAMPQSEKDKLVYSDHVSASHDAYVRLKISEHEQKWLELKEWFTTVVKVETGKYPDLPKNKFEHESRTEFSDQMHKLIHDGLKKNLTFKQIVELKFSPELKAEKREDAINKALWVVFKDMNKERFAAK